MKAEEFKIKVTNCETGESCIISLDDIFGYEGEVTGVFICYKPEIPKSLQGERFNGNNDNLDFVYAGAEQGVSDYKIKKTIERLSADDKS